MIAYRVYRANRPTGVLAIRSGKTDLEYNQRLNEIISLSIRIFLFILFAFFILEVITLLDHIQGIKSEIRQNIKHLESFNK